MSWLADTAELDAGSWLSSAYPGQGILGYDIPSVGVSGPSPVLNDSIIPGEEYRWRLVSPPAAGTLVMYEDTSFDFYGAPDGDYTFTYRLFETGVDVGTATVSLHVGPPTAALATTTAPATFSGSASSAGTVPSCSIVATTAETTAALSAAGLPGAATCAIAAICSPALAALAASVSPIAAIAATTAPAIFTYGTPSSTALKADPRYTVSRPKRRWNVGE